jgi:hypothetical protein
VVVEEKVSCPSKLLSKDLSSSNHGHWPKYPLLQQGWVRLLDYFQNWCMIVGFSADEAEEWEGPLWKFSDVCWRGCVCD